MLNKRSLFLTLIFLSTLVLSGQSYAGGPVEGKVAPAFDARLLNGSSFSLDGARGQVVVINFWASWCPPCRQEMPALDSYYQKHKEQGLKVIAVSLDDANDEAKVNEVMKAYGFDAALEKNVHYQGYGRIWRLPLTFVIDRKGILRKDGWYGPAGIDQTLLDNVVTPLLKAD
jgi:cytochrome c biogenesis protein CcmG/thiol:disulfide interchange protein DsbE